MTEHTYTYLVQGSRGGPLAESEEQNYRVC